MSRELRRLSPVNSHGVPYEHLLALERQLHHRLLVQYRNTLRLWLAAEQTQPTNSKERARLRKLALAKTVKVLS